MRRDATFPIEKIKVGDFVIIHKFRNRSCKTSLTSWRRHNLNSREKTSDRLIPPRSRRWFKRRKLRLRKHVHVPQASVSNKDEENTEVALCLAAKKQVSRKQNTNSAAALCLEWICLSRKIRARITIRAEKKLWSNDAREKYWNSDTLSHCQTTSPKLCRHYISWLDKLIFFWILRYIWCSINFAVNIAGAAIEIMNKLS